MGALQKGAELWQSGLVPFSINPDLANGIAIEEAIQALESQTNIRFVRHYLEPDYVRFSKQTAGNANSKTGRRGGEQYVNASASDSGTIIHELGHALGLMHEHQRPDRDDHITYHSENIDAALSDNYVKESAEALSAYDIQSIMHYHAGSASAPSFVSTTGVPHDEIGSRGSLTGTDCDFLNTIYPATPVIRRSDGEDGAGEVFHTSAVAVPHPGNPAAAALLVNGVQNASGRYQLLDWIVRPFGNLQRNMSEPASATAGEASHIQVVSVGSNFVSAMQDDSGKLLLISHDVSLNRLADSHGQAGEVRAVHIIALSESRVLTPVVSASGRLLSILWEIGPNGEIRRLADSGDAGQEAITVTATVVPADAGTQRVAILVNDGSSRLVLSTWRVANGSVTKEADSGDLMGVGGSARVISTPAGPLVVVCRDESGDLLLIPFRVSTDGMLERVTTPGSVKAGSVSELDAIPRPYGLLTAVIDGGGKVLLIRWSVGAYADISRLGDSAAQAGVGSRISVAALPFTTLATVVTVVRNADGNLHPITWDDTGGTGEVRETPVPRTPDVGLPVVATVDAAVSGVIPPLSRRSGQGGVTVTSSDQSTRDT